MKWEKASKQCIIWCPLESTATVIPCEEKVTKSWWTIDLVFGYIDRLKTDCKTADNRLVPWSKLIKLSVQLLSYKLSLTTKSICELVELSQNQSFWQLDGNHMAVISFISQGSADADINYYWYKLPYFDYTLFRNLFLKNPFRSPYLS